MGKEQPLITAPAEKERRPKKKTGQAWSMENCRECPLKSKCISSKNYVNGVWRRMCQE